MNRSLALLAYGIATGLFAALCAWGADALARKLGADDFNRGAVVGMVLATACDASMRSWRRKDRAP